jgi:transposase
MGGDPRLHDRDWLDGEAAERSARAIGRDLGVTADTVLRAMRLHNIPVQFATAPHKSRRPELDDREWLSAQYEQRTAAQIGASLGVAVSTVIAALERHGIRLLDARAKQRRQMPPELDDPEWLRQRYATAAGAQIAAELGVSIATVHNTMHHFDIEADGPWVRRDTTRHQRPSDRQLAKVWDANGTIRSISQAFGVAHTTAAVWLADAGIFVNDVPAISRRDLVTHIAAGDTIAQIAKQHHVTDRTVSIELRRHHLIEAHRHRPTATQHKGTHRD